jgi:hypothetical protein
MRVQPLVGRGRVLVFMLPVLLFSARAAAQVDTGTILGTVKDESGAVLPGATVTITHEGQALTLSTATRENGTYIFTPIRTGAYSIEVEFQGFKKGYGAASLSASSSRRSSTSRSSPAAWPKSWSSPPRRRCSRPGRARSVKRCGRTSSKICPSTGATTPSSRA